MTISIQNIITETLKNSSWVTFFLVFWGGAVLSLSSCTIARIPIVVGYIGGIAANRKRAFILTLSFVFALVLSYTLLGIIFGLISGVMGRMISWSRYFYYFLGALALFIGVQMAGLINLGMSSLQCTTRKPKRMGIFGAFLFGILFTVFEAPTCPVCGPVLFIMASMTFVKGKILYAVLVFFTFALGQSFPILLIGTFTSIVKYLSPKIHKIEPWVEIIAGNILIILGIYLFITG